MTRRILPALLTIATLLAVTGLARSQESVLVAEESSGLVPLDGENRIAVRDFRGSVSLRMGKPGEIRFMSAALGDSTKKRAIQVWVSGSEIRFVPPPGTEEDPRELEIVADPGVFVQVVGVRGSVTAGGLQSGIEVSGDVVDVDIRSIVGPVQITTSGGRARIEGISGDVSLRSRSCSAKVLQVKGALALNLEDSSLEASGIAGAIEAELRETQWSIVDAGISVSVRSVGGRGEARKLGGGGEIRLTTTPFTLEESKGDFDIETDADFKFERTEASLHVNSFGAAVTGSANVGLVEVRTDGSRVTLSEINGPTRVQGDNLTLHLKGVSGELFIDAKSSELDIEGTGGEVSIVTKNSTLTIKNASQVVEIDSEGGLVDVRELRAPITVTAECDLVVVEWAATQIPKDSSIKNTGGGVQMQFPPSSLMRVEAESKYGSVESEIDGIEVSDAANSAKGAIGGAGLAAVVRIVADRDILLTATSREGE